MKPKGMLALGAAALGAWWLFGRAEAAPADGEGGAAGSWADRVKGILPDHLAGQRNAEVLDTARYEEWQTVPSIYTLHAADLKTRTGAERVWFERSTTGTPAHVREGQTGLVYTAVMANYLIATDSSQRVLGYERAKSNAQVQGNADPTLGGAGGVVTYV